jgi:uncharacterized membrane protein YhaH (DUF805 family)
MQPSITEFLFSAEGRISRSQFWLKWALPYAVVTLVLYLIIFMSGVAPTIGLTILSIYLLAAIWPSIVIYVKRAHDRGRSGWFVLLFVVPFVNIWVLIELLFLRGTVGSNAHGPDPVPGG